MATKSYIIALEEHYFDPEVKRHITGLDATNVPRIVQRLDDVGELRLRMIGSMRRFERIPTGSPPSPPFPPPIPRRRPTSSSARSRGTVLRAPW